MRVVRAMRFGGPEVLMAGDAADPVAGPGQVVVEVAAAEILFLDTQLRAGWGREYFPLDPPYVPGVGVAGVVGEGVDAAWIGRRVVTGTGGMGSYAGGGYAERARVSVEEVFPVPDGLDLNASLAALHDGLMALSQIEKAGVRPGERVLVTAAGGSLGVWLVPLAAAAGGRVVAAARGERKLQHARGLGAEIAVDYTEADWGERVREALGGLDVVFDGAGGQLGHDAFRAGRARRPLPLLRGRRRRVPRDRPGRGAVPAGHGPRHRGRHRAAGRATPRRAGARRAGRTDDPPGDRPGPPAGARGRGARRHRGPPRDRQVPAGDVVTGPILVTGATGNVGREVVSGLLEAGLAVRAMARDPESARLPEGVEIVRGDLSDPASLRAPAEGAGAVFLVWPFVSEQMTGELAAAAIAAIARGAPRIVYMSAESAGEPGSPWARVERAVEDRGVEWTMLQPTGFATNARIWADQIRGGDVVRWVYGAARRSLIHERDIADVAVRALTEDGHARARHVLSGPEALSQAEQVRAIGEALGRPLRWEEESPQVVRDLLAAAFGDGGFADAAIASWAALVDRPEIVTQTVQRLTGAPARSFGQWAVDHADDFR